MPGREAERPPPLVGRDGELQHLASAIAAAREGHGRAVVVSGVAGIGKTALLNHALVLAQDAGLEVRAAAGRSTESTFPFGLARRLLTGTPADELFAAEPAPAGAGVVQELLRAVAAITWPSDRDPRHRPLLLLVDDLQWSDHWSARFVAALADHSDELPIVVVAATRPDRAEGPGAALDPVLGRAHTRVLRPAPLGVDDVREVVGRLASDAPDLALTRAVHHATGGNPFYAAAVARLLADGTRTDPEEVAALLPEEVLQSVLGRLAGLGPDAVAFARALSVLGDGHPLRIVARLAELDAATADRQADAMAAAALVAPGEPVRFAHPLVAAAVRSDQPAFAIARLHRIAADLLSAEGAAPELIGEHLARTRGEGDPTVVTQLREAARASARRGDPTAAIRFLRRALEEPPAPQDWAEVLLDLVDARAIAADDTVLDEVDDVISRLRSRDDRLRALSALATLAHHFGDFTQALALIDAGLAELTDDERASSPLQDQRIATALLHPEHNSHAVAKLHEVIAAARDGALPRSSALCALAAVEAAVADEAPLVTRLAGAAFAAGPLVDQDSYGTVLGYAAAALCWTGSLQETVDRMDAALVEAAHRGAVVAQAVAHHWRGIAGLELGRLDDALADAEQTAALHARGWTDTAWSVPLLIDVWLARGEIDRARSVADAGPEDPSRPDYAMYLEARGRLKLAMHDAEGALADAEGAGALIEGIFGRVMPRAFGWRVVAADACRLLGRREDARRYGAEAVEYIRPLGTAGPLGRALVALGVAHEPAEGLPLLEEAVAVLAASPVRLGHANALLALGVTARRARDPGRAREALYEAFEIADELGAASLANEAHSELNAVGARPRRAARSGIAGLTPGELRVAELAARGLSNPQIAHHLVISRRTVETHLARAYRKLGVSGRDDLAARFAERESGRLLGGR